MSDDRTSDADFISLFEKLGPQALADQINVTVRKVYQRRCNLERIYRRQIKAPRGSYTTRHADDHAEVIKHRISDGVVLVGGDSHIWPGDPTAAMRAFVKFCEGKANCDQPSIVALNGDVLDFPQVSRHPPIGHLKLPDIAEEIEHAQAQLHEIELAVPRATRLVWTLGNHDARFETRLATVAPEYARLNGHSLKDYFNAWSACWRRDINDDVTVKHKPKGSGANATQNTTLWAGKTTINNHLHSQKVTPITDYNGTRYGVDTGCLADPNARAFVDYTEAGPLNWRSGFCVLTFKNGKLLLPELVSVCDDKTVQFRGEIIEV